VRFHVNLPEEIMNRNLIVVEYIVKNKQPFFIEKIFLLLWKKMVLKKESRIEIH
jgi:hypothetical protein